MYYEATIENIVEGLNIELREWQKENIRLKAMVRCSEDQYDLWLESLLGSMDQGMAKYRSATNKILSRVFFSKRSED